MWNVRYKYQGKSRLYLTFPVPRRHTAEKAAEIFARKYVGKPYPNGKGFYPITDVEVVSV